jgi:hypothetical protein
VQDFEKNSVQKVQAGWRLPKLISRIIPKYCHLQRVRISHRMPNLSIVSDMYESFETTGRDHLNRSGHGDHRIVMTLSVLLTVTGGVINGAQAVNKSFPDFFDRLTDLGVELHYGMD